MPPDLAQPLAGEGHLALARRVLALMDDAQQSAAHDETPARVEAHPSTDEPDVALDAQLGEALAVAQKAWPVLRVDAEVWARYLAARLPALAQLEQALPRLNLADLFLCCACAARQPAALQAFQQRCAPVIAAALRRARLGPGLLEDMQHQLIERLLVAGPDAPPLITSYSGAGSLTSWLTVVASRAARRGLQREKKVVSSDDQRLAEELVDGDGAYLLYAKATYREAFKQAFRAAVETLPPREIMLLRQRFMDGLGLEELGAIYRVHHTTVLRWLEKARALLLRRTSQQLSDKLGIPQRECSTIMRMIQSDMDFTLPSILATPTDDGVDPQRGPRS